MNDCTAPNADFRLGNGRAPIDTDYVTVLTEFPNGIRDFQIHRKLDEESLEAINPLELLSTQTAVNILEKLRTTADSNSNSWVLSRLLVQCVKYSRNRRHLVSDSWDEEIFEDPN